VGLRAAESRGKMSFGEAMLNNREIAKRFERIGRLLELKGDNPFKTRAYFNAARTIDFLPFELKDSSPEDIRGIRGIGDALLKKILELLETGGLEYLERLEKETPPGHLELLKIPGLGPRKIRRLIDELGVNSLGELEYACRVNRLKFLKGFGAKSQENIMRGIAAVKRYRGRMLLPDAAAAAELLVEGTAGFEGVRRVGVAGSLRRSLETVGEIELVAEVEESAGREISGRFASLKGVDEIVSRGEREVVARLDGGMTCNLRMATAGEYPYALHHHTGSSGYLSTLKSYAESAGLVLDESGMYRDGEFVPAEGEEDVFEALGMSYIPPELRENTGEIDAALSRSLPELVNLDDIRGLFHVHTVWSDGSDTIAVMAAEAERMGMEYIGVADHSRSAHYANGLSPERVMEQWKEIDELNALSPGIHVFKGIECDILRDGSLDYDDSLLAGFDFVVASIHSGFSMSEREATDRIVRAVCHPSVTMLGHPTGRLLLGREGYPLDIERVLDACAVHGVVVELNADPQRLDLDWRFLRMAARKGVKVAVNPDSHSAATLGNLYYGLRIARKGWLRKEDVFNTLPLDEMMTELRAGRGGG